MEKVRPWCGQPSGQGRLKNRSDTQFTPPDRPDATKWSHCVASGDVNWSEDFFSVLQNGGTDVDAV